MSLNAVDRTEARCLLIGDEVYQEDHWWLITGLHHAKYEGLVFVNARCNNHQVARHGIATRFWRFNSDRSLYVKPTIDEVPL